MPQPHSPLPWMCRKTGNSVAYYDANGTLVSFPENHEWIWDLVRREQDRMADVKAVLDMPEIVDE